LLVGPSGNGGDAEEDVGRHHVARLRTGTDDSAVQSWLGGGGDGSGDQQMSDGNNTASNAAGTLLARRSRPVDPRVARLPPSALAARLSQRGSQESQASAGNKRKVAGGGGGGGGGGMRPVVRRKVLSRLHRDRVEASSEEGQERLRRTQALQIGVGVPDMVQNFVLQEGVAGREQDAEVEVDEPTRLSAAAAARLAAQNGGEAWEGPAELSRLASAGGAGASVNAAYVLLCNEPNIAAPPSTGCQGVFRVLRVSDFFRMNPVTRHQTLTLAQAEEELARAQELQADPHGMMARHLPSQDNQVLGTKPVVAAGTVMAKPATFDVFGNASASEGEDDFVEGQRRKKARAKKAQKKSGTAFVLDHFDARELTEDFGADAESLREQREAFEEGNEIVDDFGVQQQFEDDDVGGGAGSPDDVDSSAVTVSRAPDADDDEKAAALELAGGEVETVGLGGELVSKLKKGDLKKPSRPGTLEDLSDDEDEEWIVDAMGSDTYALEAAAFEAAADGLRAVEAELHQRRRGGADDADSGAPANKRPRVGEQPEIAEDPDLNEETVRIAVTAAGRMPVKQLLKKFRPVIKAKPHLKSRFLQLVKRLCHNFELNGTPYVELRSEFRRGLKL
jgi:hypothetical protein